MAEPFTFEARGRSRKTMIALAVVYVLLLAGFILIDAAWWIVAFLALMTLPALWDLWSDRRSGLRLTEERLEWWSGRGKGEMPVSEIDHMRFDTRLDFSVRVSAVTAHKRRIRLPYEALPPHKIFEAACQARGLKTQRHHFTLL
ncbi:hypothetical protein [Aestuariivita sp.]|jgi:hypothetical protein|uniref:hypothetical protein n=1 Tax=Aestuariivita sp. TaxID=1872407 RepID=UPI0021723372|nr:hypothetical protein [Aestuariivita sp.]MCE8008891.1 hypothetical protein [Aestuariivita sp.]